MSARAKSRVSVAIAMALTFGAAAESRYGDIVNEHFVRIARENANRRNAVLDDVNGERSAKNYRDSVQRKLDGLFRFPERTSLDARTTFKRDYGKFSVEGIVFFSRPGYPVTANLYLPAGKRDGLPAVLFLCGHAAEGKACDTYRTACIALAMKGFAVLIVDPVEQGERRQMIVDGNSVGTCTRNHNSLGKQLCIVGEWLGAWRTWDAVRALDYLETRPEIDSLRIGVTGCSGGGTLTAFLAAADNRPAAVAPCCYITSWRRNIANELPVDMEQVVPGALEAGLEIPDLLIAKAPRKTLIIGQRNDFFDARGATEAFSDVAAVNDRLGGETELFIGPDAHGYSPAARKAMYSFMTRMLNGREDASEPEIALPPKQDTYAAKGNVSSIAGQKFLWQISGEMAAKLAGGRKSEDPVAALRKILGFVDPGVPEYRNVPHSMVSGKIISRYALESPDGEIECVLKRVDQGGFFHFTAEPAILYVGDDTGNEEKIANLQVANGTTTFVLDLWGTGELTPNGSSPLQGRNLEDQYGFDYHYASLGLMSGDLIVAKRVRGIVAAVNLLAANGARKIKVVASGRARIPAIMAAALSDRIDSIEIQGSVPSFAAEASEMTTEFPLSCIVPSIVGTVEIDDLMRAMGKKALVSPQE
ncbi:MAG: acetylxylan esterase [Victivallaceae bacterium]|nr:acetylxylan esterase [Victivallaceae bacterium]